MPTRWVVVLVGALPLPTEHHPSCLVQLIFPDLVEGLVLMNIDPNGKGWIDWAAAKVGTAPNPSKPWRLPGARGPHPVPPCGARAGASHGGTINPRVPSTALRPHQHAAGHCPVAPLQPGKGCLPCPVPQCAPCPASWPRGCALPPVLGAVVPPDPGMRLEKSCSHASYLIQGSAPADAMCDLCPAQARCAQHPLALLRQRARHGQAWESRRAPQHLAASALIFCPLLAQEELVNNTELVQSYRQQIGSVVNQFNLQLFLNMYNR